MDSLFTEFFKGLTARVRPALEHEASTLVRDLTDGRYEKMEFDDNYRVRLLDRFDDSYTIERFSGGEADVASLSARVALSKIIAAQGSEALGFIVLDEVFGALAGAAALLVFMFVVASILIFGAELSGTLIGDRARGASSRPLPRPL